MELVKTVLEGDRNYSQQLPRDLRELYDGELIFPPVSAERPYVIANFVSTLDGVVSYGLDGRSSGSSISGGDPGDRFIMGLLRASVDAIIVGAGTLRAIGAGLLTPEYTYPDAKNFYADYRLSLHKKAYPLVVIVSGSGKLELKKAVFQARNVPALIVTTPAGQENLHKAGVAALEWLQVRALNPSNGRIDPLDIVRILRSQFGVETLLNEGGPTLFGQFLDANAVDELFLTLAPKIAGRSPNTFRPALVEGVEFSPEGARKFDLYSAKPRGAYLYLRYKLIAGKREE